MYINQQQYAQIERFPYISAKDYSNPQSIFQTFPHLRNINQMKNWNSNKNIQGIVIRSANDDNVHKSIKYGIWTTTQKNRSKLNQLYVSAMTQQREIYLFFSVVKSGMFEGVARLTSGINEDLFPYWWDDISHKFRDYFYVEWLYIKDVNYNHFNGLYNTEGEDVTKSKDCDLLSAETTLAMLNIFQNKPIKNKWIFNDFEFMDARERDYTRNLQQLTYTQPMTMNYNYGGGYYQTHQQNMMPIPPQIMRPVPKMSHSDLGFQMNPISRNRKK